MGRHQALVVAPENIPFEVFVMPRDKEAGWYPPLARCSAFVPADAHSSRISSVDVNQSMWRFGRGLGRMRRSFQA